MRVAKQFLFVPVLLLVGCEKKEPPTPAVSSASTSAPASVSSSKPAPQDGHAESVSAPVPPKKVIDDRTLHALSITIGVDQKLRLYLEKKGQTLRGLYVSDGAPAPVPLEGKLREGDRFELRELDEKGKPGGVFDGWFRDGLLKGTYADAKSKKPRLFTSAALVIDGKPFTQTYAGSLGGKLRIRAKLDRKGQKVEGVYRYAKSKDDLLLAGTIDPAGELVLTEKTTAGKETGRIEAFVLSSALIVGRWYAPDKTKSLPLLLEAAETYPEVVDLGGVKISPQEDYKELGKYCSTSHFYPTVDGARAKAKVQLDETFRKSMKSALDVDANACDGSSMEMPYFAEANYRVKKSKLPWFEITFTEYWSMGGAHPSFSETCKLANADTGEVFSLASKMTPEARQTLADLVVKRLREENKVEKLTDAGFFIDEPQVTETTNVCLGDKGGLMVFYNPYEIAPHVLGQPTVDLTPAEARPLVPASLAALVE